MTTPTSDLPTVRYDVMDHDLRLRDLETFKAMAYVQIQTLTEQMRAVVESQKADESKGYVELRRIIKVIGLTEIISDDWQEDGILSWSESTWRVVCAELYHRYGHLEAGGKRLWSKPPTVSDETKAMIAEALWHRQSEEAGAR